MRITLNGQSLDIPEPASIDDVVRRQFPERPHLAVAVNDAVVPRSRHAQTPLRDGDRVEIVQAVGGG